MGEQKNPFCGILGNFNNSLGSWYFLSMGFFPGFFLKTLKRWDSIRGGGFFFFPIWGHPRVKRTRGFYFIGKKKQNPKFFWEKKRGKIG